MSHTDPFLSPFGIIHRREVLSSQAIHLDRTRTTVVDIGTVFQITAHYLASLCTRRPRSQRESWPISENTDRD